MDQCLMNSMGPHIEILKILVGKRSREPLDSMYQSSSVGNQSRGANYVLFLDWSKNLHDSRSIITKLEIQEDFQRCDIEIMRRVEQACLRKI